MIFDQKWTTKYQYKRVAEDNTRWIGCTMCAYYNFHLLMVVELDTFVVMVGKHTTHIEGLQRTTPDGSGDIMCTIFNSSPLFMTVWGVCRTKVVLVWTVPLNVVTTLHLEVKKCNMKEKNIPTACMCLTNKSRVCISQSSPYGNHIH